MLGATEGEGIPGTGRGVGVEKGIPGTGRGVRVEKGIPGTGRGVGVEKGIPGTGRGVRVEKGLPGTGRGVGVEKGIPGTGRGVRVEKGIPGTGRGVGVEKGIPGTGRGVRVEKGIPGTGRGVGVEKGIPGTGRGVRVEKGLPGTGRGVGAGKGLPGTGRGVGAKKGLPGTGRGVGVEKGIPGQGREWGSRRIVNSLLCTSRARKRGRESFRLKLQTSSFSCMRLFDQTRSHAHTHARMRDASILHNSFGAPLMEFLSLAGTDADADCYRSPSTRRGPPVVGRRRWRPLAAAAAVLQVLHLVDAHDPVLGGVRLLDDVQLKVLVADLHVAHAVVAGRLACATRNRVTAKPGRELAT